MASIKPIAPWPQPPLDPLMSDGTQQFLNWVQQALNSLVGTTQALTAPTGVTTKGFPGAVLISWNEAPGANTYNIYESTISAIPSASNIIAIVPHNTAGPSNSFLRAGLTDNTTRYYAVAAVKLNGTVGTISSPVAGASTTTVIQNSPVANVKGQHILAGFTIGQLSDPFVINTVAGTGGTIAAGTYHFGITTFDSTGESFTNDATVTVGANGTATINWVPIWGAQGYKIYFGSTLAAAYLQTTVSGDAANTYTLTSIINTSGPVAPLANASGGQAEAGVVLVSNVPGAPSAFWLNLGNLDNSQAGFFFSDHKGICASFQTKGTGGSPITGGKSELDVAFNGDSIQLLVPDTTNPATSLKELDIFVNNVQVISFRQTLEYFYKSINVTPVSLAGTQASPILQFTDSQAGTAHAWKLIANSSDQFEIDHDATEMFYIDASSINANFVSDIVMRPYGTITTSPFLIWSRGTTDFWQAFETSLQEWELDKASTPVLRLLVPTAGQILIADASAIGRWNTPDGARVFNSVAESIPSATVTILTFDSERWNSGGMHSTTTNPSRLTAQKAGKYLITAHMNFAPSTAGSYRVCGIRLNGTTIIASLLEAPNSNGVDFSVATIWSMAVGDYVEVDCSQDSGGALNTVKLADWSPEFCAQWLGP